MYKKERTGGDDAGVLSARISFVAALNMRVSQVGLAGKGCQEIYLII